MKDKCMLFCLMIFSLLLFDVRLIMADSESAKTPPIVITSQTLTSDNKAKLAIFEGNVHAKRGDVHLYADIMKIYYKSEGQETSNKIYKIEADGNVKLIRGKNILTSRSALYDSEPVEVIIFTGEPRASDGENVIIGTKMTYYIKEDKTVVEDSKVMIAEKEKLIRQ